MSSQTTQSPVSPMDAALAVARAQDGRYARVLRVTSLTLDGRPRQVVIPCSVEGCTNEREIASQDLFQVHRCGQHQNEAVKAARRARAKRRNSSLRARIAELEAKLGEAETDEDETE